MSTISEFSTRIKNKLSEIYEKTIGRFISTLFKRPSSILFLGIDNAGKTTLVNKLKNNTNDIFLPTKHSTKDVIEIGNLKALAVDIGGHKAVRMAWKDYFFNVDGIVFIVDTEDQSRFEEVCEAWNTVLELEKEAPIVVLMNKIDLLGETTNSIAMNQNLMRFLEESTGICRNQVGQPIDIVYLSVVNESTYNESSVLRGAFTWLSNKINEKDKKKVKST